MRIFITNYSVMQHKIVIGEIGDGRVVLKDLRDAFADKAVVALLLDLDEVGNIDDFVDLPELAPLRLPVLVNG